MLLHFPLPTPEKLLFVWMLSLHNFIFCICKTNKHFSHWLALSPPQPLTPTPVFYMIWYEQLFAFSKVSELLAFSNHCIQDVTWTQTTRPKNVLGVFWMSQIHSGHLLRPGGDQILVSISTSSPILSQVTFFNNFITRISERCSSILRYQDIYYLRCYPFELCQVVIT